ncbi:MAG: ATP-binding protein [Planctomycetes bacterium]|nr:ATP-binding protein [Planctomycetota bacterium]
MSNAQKPSGEPDARADADVVEENGERSLKLASEALSETKPSATGTTQPFLAGLQLFFADRFLKDHAGQVITDPRIAIVELIANAYDAGATQVEIYWPTEKGEEFAIKDNGTGMTRSELEKRWTALSYDRVKEQGEFVKFPPDVKALRRVAFGRSGKGRYAALCFADSYRVSTWKDGKGTTARIGLPHTASVPFEFNIEKEEGKNGHGTQIHATAERRVISVDDLSQLIGSKFLVDPSFDIRVNGRAVQLLDLINVETTKLNVSPHGEVTVHQFDSGEQGRTGHLRGITWWVNQRMVGEPSWDRLDDEGAYLDGRTDEAKRFSFVVIADLFKKEDVKSDWSDFHASERVNAAKHAVHAHVVQSLHRLLASTRRAQKRAALEKSRELLGGLPIISKKIVSQFVDQIQEKCPTIHPRDLSRTVEVLAKLEQTRSGYDLLKQLAACSPDDLDTWNRLMEQWTATNAEIVLNELQRRLRLIERLQPLVESSRADELHDLQPLFERGLWIFGPEYEAVEFCSNRTLAEVIGNLLGGTQQPIPRRRPDFVALPDSSIGVYGAAAYAETGGEISGFKKVLIVELKRGGFNVTQKEMDQARDYAKELRKAGRVQPSTEIVAYVLGATLEEGLTVAKYGERDETFIIPMTYQTVLQRAHARTFNLQRRIEETQPRIVEDAEVQAVVGQVQPRLFDASK